MGLVGKPKRKPKPPEWMIVYTTNSIEDVHIVAGRLKSEGIETMVHVQPGASAMGITIGTFGEVKLLVQPEDYEDAINILDPEPLDELSDSSEDVIYKVFDDEDEDNE